MTKRLRSRGSKFHERLTVKNQETIQLTLPADPAYVPVATCGAEVFSRKRGFEHKMAQQISLALEEAILNSFEMGYSGLKDEIKIHMTASPAGLEITVHCLGLPLDPEQLPQYSSAKAGSRYDASGLSFFLVKQLMDEVFFSTRINGERKLRFIKHLPLTAAVPDRAGDLEKTGRKHRLDREFSHLVRLSRPDDAEDISRLVLRAHGQVLFSEDIYYPARVEEMIRCEKMVSVVAVSDDGEIFGHGALVPVGSQGGIEEMTYGFVNPDFRSRGAVSDIARVLIQNAGTRQVSALMTMAVTNHVLSQKASARLGFKESALLVATSAASAKVGNDQTSDLGRIGNIVQMLYLNQTDPPRLYIPRRHEYMILKIYRNLEKTIVSETVPHASMELPSGSAQIWSESNLVEGWMTIYVSAFGSDIQARVNQCLQEAVLQQISAVQLLLPLEEPFTPLLSPQFEKDGFFFAGVGPGEGAKEYLILQYINSPNPSYENIEVLEGLGEEIKTYVLQCSLNKSGA